MLKPIKIHGLDTEIFGISDLHYGHDKPFLWSKRGYESGKAHDEGVIEKWNSVCSESATVIHTGDWVFQDPKGEKCRELFRRLNFETLYMTWGNHNSGVKHIYAKELADQYGPQWSHCDRQVYPLIHKVGDKGVKAVVFLPQYVEFIINGTVVIACHYPLLVHNEQKHGAHLWTGHSHQSLPLTNKDTGQGKRIDLGVEGWGRPLSFAEIKLHLQNRDLDIRDHHENTVA